MALIVVVYVLFVVRALLESPLSFDNYARRFQLLLYLEETQMQWDIRAYDMKDAEMVRDHDNKRLLVLKVQLCYKTASEPHSQQRA